MIKLIKNLWYKFITKLLIGVREERFAAGVKIRGEYWILSAHKEIGYKDIKKQ